MIQPWWDTQVQTRPWHGSPSGSTGWVHEHRCSDIVLPVGNANYTRVQGKGGGPLHPMPLVSVPFERIGIDIVGLLIQASSGHKFLLVIIDYATRYPEAIPMQNMRAETIAREMTQVFTRVGIPKQVITDQGTSFMSEVLQAVRRFLGVQPLRTSVYYLQTYCLVERFNRMLKRMLQKFVGDNGRDWPQWISYLFFAVREVPQASTGFSPFELLYGRQPRGLLDVLREEWETPASTEGPPRFRVAAAAYPTGTGGLFRCLLGGLRG